MAYIEMVKNIIYDVSPDDIKAIRDDLGLDKAEFAERIGVSYESIRAYESGRVIPSYEVLIAICELTGCEFKITPKTKHPLLIKKMGAKSIESRPEIRP